jgi:hypothetical protein
MSKAIGIYNPNSRNRTHKRDEDLSPVDLPEIVLAQIDIEAQEKILQSIPDGFDDFRKKTEARLVAARTHLSELAPSAIPQGESEEDRLLRNIDNEEKFIAKYQEGYPWLCDEARVRLKFYRVRLAELQKESAEDSALAHIHSLVGADRLTINQMNDVVDLFRQSYADKHVPDKNCPRCGGKLIVKEHRRRLRKGGEQVTNFVGCCMFERTGCSHKEPFTPEIKHAIDTHISTADTDLGI